MLRGIQAFEARWLDLRQIHPTTRDDNTLIAHAMGQLVDQYASPVLIESNLPEHLRLLFRDLAVAYFHGYVPMEPVPASTAVCSLADPPHQAAVPPDQPKSSKAEIAAAVAQVKALAQRASQRKRRSSSQSAANPSEEDTLIIDFPQEWITSP